ncbi:MAG: Zinc transporter, periplasmic-binding protein ZnuA [Cyanobacteria bacterium RYN_339]|nr:Zinc transporter, periplasmic-binding protein ZnuA [Cyanobacteria bacterium RYN_339]
MRFLRTLSWTAAVTAALLAWPALAEAKVKVVATLPDLATVAREVGGPDVEVTALSVPTQDPHFVDARPSLVLPLNRADLLVLTGLQLEVGWLPNLIVGSRNPRIQTGTPGQLDASTVVPLKGVPTEAISRAQGDIHPGGNPHYMIDPREGARVAKAIADRLGQLDPAHRAGYSARAATLATGAANLAAKEAKRFASLPSARKQVVVYHESMIYLLQWLGVKQIDTLEPKPGIPPSPQHVAMVIVKMKGDHVPVILYEDYRPRNTGALVAEKTNAKLVIVPGGPDFDHGQSYLAYVQDVTNKLFAGLQP